MFFCILFTFFSLSSFSQIQGESEVSLRGDLIEPEFEGGLEGFQKVFYAMIKEKKVKRGEVVVASFVIDKNGIMTNIKIIPKCPLDVVVRENYTIKLQGTEIFTRRCSLSYIEDKKLSTEVILK